MRIEETERLHDQEVRDEDDDAREHLNQQESKHGDISARELVSAEGVPCRDGHRQPHERGPNTDDEGISHPRPKRLAAEHVGKMLTGIGAAKRAS